MKTLQSLMNWTRLAQIFCALCLFPGQGLACDVCVSDEVVVKTYLVEGSTLNQLRRDMRKKGPNGYWAYTTTKWNWDSRCNMRFVAHVTMPELADRTQLKQSKLQIWDDMIEALMAHEMQHVEIGRAWASEIKLADCKRAAVKRINAKYDNADEMLDARTLHGRLTGVTLDR